MVETVAITIPACGDSPLFREAVASVLAQDCSAWSMLVCDDGPDDARLAEWFGALGPQVTYQRNPRRLGINRNFQRCLDEADGEWLTIMGADDRLLPSYVSTMLRVIRQHPDAAWVQPGVRVIDRAGFARLPLADRLKKLLRPRGPRVLGGQRLATSLLRGNWMYFPSVAFRADPARRAGFREGYDIVLDLDLYLRMLLDAGTAMLIDDVVFEYRRHEASLSSVERTSGSRFVEERVYFREAARTVTAQGWGSAARAARWHLTSRLHALSLLPAALRRRDSGLLGELMRHALVP